MCAASISALTLDCRSKRFPAILPAPPMFYCNEQDSMWNKLQHISQQWWLTLKQPDQQYPVECQERKKQGFELQMHKQMLQPSHSGYLPMLDDQTNEKTGSCPNLRIHNKHAERFPSYSHTCTDINSKIQNRHYNEDYKTNKVML
jgi:hypothetical protein